MITVAELRLKAAERAGIKFTGTLSDLSPNDRERLIDAMAVIVSETPGNYSVEVQEFAAKRIQGPFFGEPIKDFGPLDAAKTFAAEFLDQGRQIVTFEHPLLRAALFVGMAAAAVYVASKATAAAKTIKAE